MAAANSLQEDGRALAKSDVVKRGLLKFKASKVKGTAGSSARGPKSVKSIFLVFRSLHSGDKFLHLYSNEKKFHEASNPKWEVFLADASSVYFLTDRRSFCVSMTDGGLLFMDCSSIEDCEDWVQCLNAVLFAKSLKGDGVLHYEVDLLPSKVLPHEGPSVLEISHYELVVWNRPRTREVVRWKLNHLRSFRAKNKLLTIVSGNRSCTGHREFEFQSKYSVQITHTIETIVARVKYRSSPTTSPRNSQDHSNAVAPGNWSRPLPTQSAMLSNIPNVVDPIHPQGEGGGVTGTMLKHIPNFTHEDVFECAEGSQDQNYGKLHCFTPGMQPVQRSPAMGGGAPVRTTPPRSLPLTNSSIAQYDVIDTPTKKISRGAGTPVSSQYDVIDTPTKKISRGGGTPVSRQGKVQSSGYEQIDLPRRQCEDTTVSPRVPLPRESSRSAIAMNKQTSYPPETAPVKTTKPSPVERYKKFDRSGATGVSVDVGGAYPETYSSLEHGPNDQNSALAIGGYGELNHAGGKVLSQDHPYINCNAPSSTARMKGYEVLQGDSNPMHSFQEHKNQLEENDGYGRLTHARVSTTRAGGSNEVSEGDSQSKFNPYDTMPRSNRVSVASEASADSVVSEFDDPIEEEASTPIYRLTGSTPSKSNNRENRESQSTLEGSPPPGYETLSTYSKLERPSTNLSIVHNSSATSPDAPTKPLVPPRRTSYKRRYENIGPNGEVLAETIPPAPEEGVTTSTPYENVSSSEQAVEERQELSVMVSAAADVSGGDKGTKSMATVPSNSPASSSVSPPPPPPNGKPQTAPKPKVKPKPKNV